MQSAKVRGKTSVNIKYFKTNKPVPFQCQARLKCFPNPISILPGGEPDDFPIVLCDKYWAGLSFDI